jgi:hypothetical protein
MPSCCTQRDFTFIGIVYKVKIELFARFSWNSVWEFFRRSYDVCMISVKTGSVTAILYFGVWMNSFLYFLYVLADLGEAQPRESAGNAFEKFWVLWKYAQLTTYFTYSCRWIYVNALRVYCPVKSKCSQNYCNQTHLWFWGYLAQLARVHYLLSSFVLGAWMNI